MNRAHVKVLMAKRGLNFSIIANSLDVTPQSIYEVISGRMNSKRVERVLEELLEMPIRDIRIAWNTPVTRTDISSIVHKVNNELQSLKVS